MGWRITVKAGRVRDIKNKRRKTGKKRGWSGGSGPANEPKVVPGSDPSLGSETVQSTAAIAVNPAIAAQSATVSPATPAPAQPAVETLLATSSPTSSSTVPPSAIPNIEAPQLTSQAPAPASAEPLPKGLKVEYKTNPGKEFVVEGPNNTQSNKIYIRDPTDEKEGIFLEDKSKLIAVPIPTSGTAQGSTSSTLIAATSGTAQGSTSSTLIAATSGTDVPDPVLDTAQSSTPTTNPITGTNVPTSLTATAATSGTIVPRHIRPTEQHTYPIIITNPIKMLLPTSANNASGIIYSAITTNDSNNQVQVSITTNIAVDGNVTYNMTFTDKESEVVVPSGDAEQNILNEVPHTINYTLSEDKLKYTMNDAQNSKTFYTKAGISKELAAEETRPSTLSINIHSAPISIQKILQPYIERHTNIFTEFTVGKSKKFYKFNFTSLFKEYTFNNKNTETSHKLIIDTLETLEITLFEFIKTLKNNYTSDKINTAIDTLKQIITQVINLNKLTRIKLIGYIEEGDERPRITNNTKKLQESTIEHYIYQLFQTKLSEFRIKLTDRILPSLVNASKVNFI